MSETIAATYASVHSHPTPSVAKASLTRNAATTTREPTRMDGARSCSVRTVLEGACAIPTVMTAAMKAVITTESAWNMGREEDFGAEVDRAFD
eukprot:7385728-Prymnesium_polylepis.1